MHAYPTLAVVDRARGAYGPRFAEDPDAASLERRARELADEYWGETVWLTGLVSEAAFQAVCSALERDRSARDVPVTQ